MIGLTLLLTIICVTVIVVLLSSLALGIYCLVSAVVQKPSYSEFDILRDSEVF